MDFLKAQVPDAKLKLFPNIDNAYLELATGRVDAAVHDTPNVQYYANTAGKGRVKVVGSVKSGDFYGIAFPKGSDLVPQVNKALATLKPTASTTPSTPSGSARSPELCRVWFSVVRGCPAAVRSGRFLWDGRIRQRRPRAGRRRPASPPSSGAHGRLREIVEFDWSVIRDALPNLLEGTLMTVKITFWGLFGGFLLGALSGVVRAYGHPILSGIAQVYVAVIRGTPIVVQVMFIYFALPIMAGIRVDAEWAAIVTLMINSGAYISEIVRGSLLSVHKGLKEAGQAMGLPFHKILLHIIGPVAFRRMIPPLGNQCIISLKDSSLFIVIGVAELTRQGQEIMAANFRAVEIWSAVAIVYLILTGAMALGLRLLEKRMRIL